MQQVILRLPRSHFMWCIQVQRADNSGWDPTQVAVNMHRFRFRLFGGEGGAHQQLRVALVEALE